MWLCHEVTKPIHQQQGGKMTQKWTMGTAWAVLPSAAGPWVTYVEAKTSSLSANDLHLHGVYSCSWSFCLPAPCRAVVQLGMTWLCIAKGTAWGTPWLWAAEGGAFHFEAYKSAIQQLFCPTDGALQLILWLELEVWEQFKANPFILLTLVIFYFFFWTGLNYPIIKLRTGFGNSLQSRPGLIN